MIVTVSGRSGLTERVQVGVVGHRILADEGRFAVTRCLARLHRPRDQPRHGHQEHETLLHGSPPPLRELLGCRASRHDGLRHAGRGLCSPTDGRAYRIGGNRKSGRRARFRIAASHREAQPLACFTDISMRPSDRPVSRAEPTLPQRIADYDAEGEAGRSVAGRKRPANGRHHAQRGEVIRRHHVQAHPRRASRSGQIVLVESRRRDRFENAGALDIHPLGLRHPDVVRIDAWQIVLGAHHPIGFRVGQRGATTSHRRR